MSMLLRKKNRSIMTTNRSPGNNNKKSVLLGTILGCILLTLLLQPILQYYDIGIIDTRRIQLNLIRRSHNGGDGDDDNDVNPFPPPLYGYASFKEMNGRVHRFPSIMERVQVYMSDWYLPPCKVPNKSDQEEYDDDGYLHYRFIFEKNDDDDNHDDDGGGIWKLLVREVVNEADAQYVSRSFLIDPSNTLNHIHYLQRSEMAPEYCDSEYCADILQHWYPAYDRVVNQSSAPVLFQFSDEELSRAYNAETNKDGYYPSLPHLKKSRLSLLPQDWPLEEECSPIPKPIHPTISHDDIPQHTPPIIAKLKTNRHYGMIGRIPPQDIPWSEKKDQAIFRGTLTGYLPPGSRFSLSTRNSHAETLPDKDAEEKCLELDRCRLVYGVNKFYKNNDDTENLLVDAKLVLPLLQHTDMPEIIHDIPLFGNRKTKQGLMKYKAIIMLEGNDAGTGFKWGLFSNSVIMAPAPLKFTSWAMEELLEPWLHYIPLDTDNFEEDVHDKMQWVLDHDEEAQNIARRGSLWIRDLLLHPDAAPDDETVTEEIIRRYMMHWKYDESLELPNGSSEMASAFENPE